jgi:asparagine synthase (glutamine-hydrolysing)
MGFPTPLTEWMRGEARDFIHDVFGSAAARTRTVINNRAVLDGLEREPRFGRGVWGLLCLELWQQTFHDRASEFTQAAGQERIGV